MANIENRQIELGSIASDDRVEVRDAFNILYALPLYANNQQLEFVERKYAKISQHQKLKNLNILKYQSIDPIKQLSFVLPISIHKIYTFCQYVLKIRKDIKLVSTMHLFFFPTVSFLFQIIPLLIIGKFYRKNVVIEFCDFKNYYLPEESSSIVRFFLQLADGIVVQSDRQCRSLKQKKIKAATLQTSVEIPSSEARVIEKVQPKILVSAKFEEVFNINSILKAFELVKQKYPRSEIVISGEGSQYKQVSEIVSSCSCGGVSLDENTDSHKLFSESEIFIHSYHIEYFAPEILKAMSYGVPVVSSPIGMVDNLTQKENILVFQFNDYSKLADYLLLLIENESVTKQISENSIKFVKKYSSNSKFDKISNFYQNLS